MPGVAAPILATTYHIVFEASERYHENPNAETKAALERAANLAGLMDICLYASFIVLPCLGVLLCRWITRRFSSKPV